MANIIETTKLTTARARLLLMASGEVLNTLQRPGTKLSDLIVYSTIAKQQGLNIINFFTNRDTIKPGITNMAGAETGGKQVFFIDNVRCGYGQIFKADSANEVEDDATKVTEQKMAQVEFKPVPAFIRNAHLNITIGGAQVLTEFPLSCLSYPAQLQATDLQFGTYRFENPYFILPDTAFSVSLKLQQGTLKAGEVLRIQLQGLEIKL